LKGANVVIDQGGRARLTEYGLAPINSDPSFTVAATPGAVGTSRWLAPEIINPTRKGTTMPTMESKAADVFAFGMFAVEVFTGKIPFEEQKNEAVVLRISRGGRPEMPGDAQALGLTGEMWMLLESCWQQNSKKRPTMEVVVKRWQKFVDNNGYVVPEGPQPAMGPTPGTGRNRAMTAAVQPPTRSEPPRLRTRSEIVQPRTRFEAGRPRMNSEAVQQGTELQVFQQGTKPEVIQNSTRPEAARNNTKPEVVQPLTQPQASRTTRKPKRKWFCGLF